jgi:hypothetical protein
LLSFCFGSASFAFVLLWFPWFCFRFAFMPHLGESFGPHGPRAAGKRALAALLCIVRLALLPLLVLVARLLHNTTTSTSIAAHGEQTLRVTSSMPDMENILEGGIYLTCDHWEVRHRECT